MIAVFGVTVITPTPGRSFPHWLASMGTSEKQGSPKLRRIITQAAPASRYKLKS